jgi:hypothetical protein
MTAVLKARSLYAPAQQRGKRHADPQGRQNSPKSFHKSLDRSTMQRAMLTIAWGVPHRGVAITKMARRSPPGGLWTVLHRTTAGVFSTTHTARLLIAG